MLQHGLLIFAETLLERCQTEAEIPCSAMYDSQCLAKQGTYEESVSISPTEILN